MLRGESVDHHDLPEEDEEMDSHGSSDEDLFAGITSPASALAIFPRTGSPCP